MDAPPYQVFDDLDAAAFAALKADILAHGGPDVPTVYDEAGNILDGHQRQRAVDELRAEGCAIESPSIVLTGLREDEKRDRAVALNTLRRQLTPEHRQRVVGRLQQWGWSQRRIAAALGVSVGTVNADVAGVQHRTPEVVGTDGKTYPARRAPAVLCQTGNELVGVLDALQDAPPGVLPERITDAKRAIQLIHNATRQPEPARTIAPPTGKYRCLVIDPPWEMRKLTRDAFPAQGEALDYPTLAVDAIAALPVAALAHDDGCHLYLWSTQAHVPDALWLVEQWGFTYECLLTWVKHSGFTPFSWMYNAEPVIFARRGDLPLLHRGLKSTFLAPSLRHSQKPDVFYARVREASPLPRLELFGRGLRDGFDVWGDDVGLVAAQ